MTIDIRKKFLVTIILFFVLIAEGCVYILRENKKMATLNEATIISEAKAKELGYNIAELEVIADEQNLIWHKYRENVSVDFTSLDNKLRTNQYWAIYYKPKKSQVGGDLFIFLDKETGAVIGYLRGQ